MPHDSIILSEYDPDWPRLFETERERLQTAIGAWAVAMEHVGSTAIPGINPMPGQTTSGIGRTHQVHMYEQTHEQYINHLALRDYLRSNADARREYEALKRRLAEEHTDIERYADAKSDFVREALARARAAGLEVA
jgi:GrpB-like predicted nucleotidyltransferase (UPF0157 family)